MTTELKHLTTTKYALSLHTTTPELGLAISNFADDTRSQVWNLGRDLSSLIHQYLVAISTLAAVAWSEASKSQNLKTIAVEMPAQRGQIFAAIYQFEPDTSKLKMCLSDRVFTPETWQETLANWNTNYQLIQAQSGLAATVTSILELANLDWQEGNFPNWSEALPYYGQHPVQDA